MHNLVSLFSALTEESDPLVNELQDLTLASPASALSENVLRLVTEASPLECCFESTKVVRIALHSGFQDSRIDKLAAALDLLAHKLLETNCSVHLTVMHLGLSEAVSGSLENVIIYLARSIIGITYAHGGCAHNEEVQNRLVRLISNAPGLMSLNLEQCEGMTSQQLKACVLSVRSLETLNLAQCTTLESNDVAVFLSKCVKAHTLRFAGCKSLKDSAFKNVARLHDLRVLDLSRCSITDETTAQLTTLQLEKLNLQKCRSITSKSFEHVAQFSRPLLALDITGTQSVSQDMLVAIATRHMYAQIAADYIPFDQKNFDRMYPFVLLSKQEASIERGHEPLAVILQFLQRHFQDATCEFFTTDDDKPAVRMILPQVPQAIEMLPQPFLDYLKRQNVHLQIAYEVMASPVFRIMSEAFLGAFQSVTFIGNGQSISYDIVGCKSIHNLVFIDCPLRDADLAKFASDMLLHLKIRKALLLTDAAFKGIPEMFPKLESLDLRKCGKLSYAAIASLALQCSEFLDCFLISKPVDPIGSLAGLQQDEIIALLVKLAHSDLKGVEEAITTIAAAVEVKPENFATFTYLATKYKIPSLQSKLAIWLSTTFNDSLFLTVDADRYSLTISSTIADSEQLAQLVSGILTTGKRILLNISLTEGGVNLDVLAKIASLTASCRDGIVIRNQTKNISHVKVLCEQLLSNDQELSFENCEFSSEAFKVIVSKCPMLRRFRAVQCTGIGIHHVVHLLSGSPSLVHFGLVDCKEKLPKLLEAIHKEAPQLQELDLSGADVSSFRQNMLPNLRKVNLANSNLDDTVLKALDHPELVEADFEGTRVTNVGMFEFLSQPRKVEKLSLSGTGVDSLCLYKMPASMANLRQLHLAKCNVTEDALLMLADGQKQLDVLDVMHCPSINKSLSIYLTGSAAKTTRLLLSMEDKISPKSLEILMTHFRAVRSLMLSFCNETTYTQMYSMFRPASVENIEKFSISGYLRKDIELLELIINRLQSLIHFVWRGPVSFGAFTTFAKASKLQKLKIICEDAKSIVDVDAAIIQLDCKSLRYLTLIGFAKFSPRGLVELLERQTQLKGLTLSQSDAMTKEAVLTIQSRFKTKITLV